MTAARDSGIRFNPARYRSRVSSGPKIPSASTPGQTLSSQVNSLLTAAKITQYSAHMIRLRIDVSSNGGIVFSACFEQNSAKPKSSAPDSTSQKPVVYSTRKFTRISTIPATDSTAPIDSQTVNRSLRKRIPRTMATGTSARFRNAASDGSIRCTPDQKASTEITDVNAKSNSHFQPTRGMVTSCLNPPARSANGISTIEATENISVFIRNAEIDSRFHLPTTVAMAEAMAEPTE